MRGRTSLCPRRENRRRALALPDRRRRGLFAGGQRRRRVLRKRRRILLRARDRSRKARGAHAAGRVLEGRRREAMVSGQRRGEGLFRRGRIRAARRAGGRALSRRDLAGRKGRSSSRRETRFPPRPWPGRRKRLPCGSISRPAAGSSGSACRSMASSATRRPARPSGSTRPGRPDCWASGTSWAGPTGWGPRPRRRAAAGGFPTGTWAASRFHPRTSRPSSPWTSSAWRAPGSRPTARRGRDSSGCGVGPHPIPDLSWVQAVAEH